MPAVCTPRRTFLRHFCAVGLAVAWTACWASGAEDERPVVDDSKAPREKGGNPQLPTVFLVGDSTVKSDKPMRGWGQELPAYFDPMKVNVANRAIGGRSSRTFQTEGRWDKVIGEVKRGDFILIQFGTNDVGRYDDPAAKGRPSLHGDGEETAVVTRPDGSSETVHTFGWYMRKYGEDAKAKGATAVFLSMVPHKVWKGNRIGREEGDTFVKWTQSAAKASGAYFVNLNEIVAREYDRLGAAAVEPLFADKGTHTSPAGAQVGARAVVAGLRAVAGAPLDRFLSAEGKAVTPVDRSLTGQSEIRGR